MGKGDKKTRRGKIFQGSFGVRRPKKKDTLTAAEVTQAARAKEVKPPPPEPKPTKAASTRKEAKPKKAENPARKHE